MSTTTRRVAEAEARAMLRALELAGLGVRGANPLVGAVLLAPDGTVLGEGHHRGAGTPHAEPAALADAGDRGHDPRGGTMVVTLEPCNHTGRTGPCSEALISAGVARVVFAADDVNGPAAGGASRLRAAGVGCVGGVEAEASKHLNERWTASVAAGRPFVTLKSAQSLDGQVAAVDGSASGSPDRRRAPTATASGPSPTRSSWAAGPCATTIRASPRAAGPRGRSLPRGPGRLCASRWG